MDVASDPFEDELGLVLPVYKPNVERLVRYADELRTRLDPAVLRVELDAPSPDVPRRLEKAGLHVHASEQRRGKGAAITDGFDALDTEILAFVDADASTAVPSVQRIVDTVGNGASVAVGSRRHPDSEVTDRALHREVLSWGLGFLARLFFDVTLRDYQCGAKALRRKVWKTVRPSVTETGFAWDMEFLVAADQAGFAIEEVPVTWSGSSASSMDTVPAVREFARALVTIPRRS